MDKINMDQVNKINSGFNLENMNSNNGSNLSTTLKQGIQFKKYQDKITTNKKTEEIHLSASATFTSSILAIIYADVIFHVRFTWLF
jgi:hypothetical protein